MLRVSVIIPAYNRANYLPLALQSILDQSRVPDEIIVIDDGSSDGTSELAQAYEPRVRYFSQDHRGVAAARNLGLAVAQGDVIAWLDADDLWEPNFLATTLSILEEQPAVWGVYTGSILIDADGNKLTQSNIKSVSPADLYPALIDGDLVIVTPGIVLRKNCFTEVGTFDAQLAMCEDYDMWLRIAHVTRLVGVPRPLVRIRVHDSNTHRDSTAFFHFLCQVGKKQFGPAECEPETWPEYKRRFYAHIYRVNAIRLMQEAQDRASWLYLSQAVRTWPKILEKLDVFYEAICGNQVRGHRGRPDLGDIEDNTVQLLRWLDDLFVSADTVMLHQRRTAYYNAYLAAAMLHDQAGRWSKARRCLLHAIKAKPVMLTSGAVLRRLLKLYIGQRPAQLAQRLLRRLPEPGLPW